MSRAPKAYVKKLLNNLLPISRNPGIYVIVNKKSAKFYIGSTVNLYNRKRAHLSALRRNRHYCRYLQRSFNLHGESFFEIGCLERCDNRALVSREQYWIDQFWDLGCLYNGSSQAKREGAAAVGKEKLSRKHYPQCIVSGCGSVKNHGKFCNSHWSAYYYGMIDSEGNRIRNSKKGKIRHVECIAKYSGSGDCSPLLMGKFCSKHKNHYRLGIIDEKGNKLREIRKGAKIFLECVAKNSGTGECGGKKFGRFCKKHYGQYENGIIDIKGKKLRDFQQGKKGIRPIKKNRITSGIQRKIK